MSRKAYPILSHNTEGLKAIGGTFQINAGADPDVITGNGFTVARTSAGKYTVTLGETFHRCVALTGSVLESGADKDNQVRFEEVDLTATFSSFIAYTMLGAADTETDNQQVSFIALVASTGNVSQRSS